MSVHHMIGRADGSVDELEANEWQIIMYQGAAYAVQTEDLVKWSLAQVAYDLFAAPPTFYDLPKSSSPISVADSTALFYWYSRWPLAAALF